MSVLQPMETVSTPLTVDRKAPCWRSRRLIFRRRSTRCEDSTRASNAWTAEHGRPPIGCVSTSAHRLRAGHSRRHDQIFGLCGYQRRPDNAGPRGILAPWLTKTPEIEPSTRRSRRWTKSPLPCRPTSSKNTRQIPSGPPRRARPPILSSFYGRPENVSAKDYEPSRRTRSPGLTRSRSAGNDPNRAQPRQRDERATRQQHDHHTEAIAAHQADTENCSDSGDDIFLHLHVSFPATANDCRPYRGLFVSRGVWNDLGWLSGLGWLWCWPAGRRVGGDPGVAFPKGWWFGV